MASSPGRKGNASLHVTPEAAGPRVDGEVRRGSLLQRDGEHKGRGRALQIAKDDRAFRLAANTN